MKPPKTKLLIFVLIAVLVALALLQTLKSSNSSPEKINNSQISKYLEPPKLKIMYTNIPTKPIAVTNTIKITFDKPVDSPSLVLRIDPEEEVTAVFDQNFKELTIKPVNAWDFDTRYTITVFQSTKSQDQQTLDKDYEFMFQSEAYIGI